MHGKLLDYTPCFSRFLKQIHIYIYIYITSRARESETKSALAWTIDEKERVAGAGFTR